VHSWLARRPCFYLQFTTLNRSWLNQVERRFALITNQIIRRCASAKVPDVKRKINSFVQQYSQDRRPFR
jgi:hypothetical protein